MKKKIICFILTALMLISAMPISVFADEVSDIIEENSRPIVKVESMYFFDKGKDYEFRALPDDFGTFYFDISLNKAPDVDEEIVVFYRTVDDSAVAKWGDYEAVGAHGDAYVVLNKANGYKARVNVNSIILDTATVQVIDEQIEPDRIVSRRFIFELTKVDGNAVLRDGDKNNRNKFYCYLRANTYFNVGCDWVSRWVPDLTSTAQNKMPNFVMNYDNPINTEFLYGDKSISGEINYQFPYEALQLLSTGDYQLGISMIGICREDYWNSDGPVTFDLYYTYKGKKQKALSLVIEGEFDESTYFGWESAFDYAYRDYSDEDLCGAAHDKGYDKNFKIKIDDFIDDCFYGITVYDNEGAVAYSATKASDRDEVKLGNALKKLVLDKKVVSPDRSYGSYYLNIQKYNRSMGTENLHYLTLPSNFAYADSYSWEFTTVTSPDEQDEARRLENVLLICQLISSDDFTYAKDASGKQMITTNADTLQEGDPLRMSIRYNKNAIVNSYEEDCYITAKINGKYDVKMTLRGLDGSDWGTINDGKDGYCRYEHTQDTLVFEGEIPDELKGTAITSIRNIELHSPDEIQSFITHQRPVDKGIADIYIKGRDLRTPAATIGSTSSDIWAKSKSVDIYVNTKENSNARFNDSVTVYYQWSNSKELPKNYGSRVQLNPSLDGEIFKTVIGRGNGEMYLHLKSVSGYGKSSISDSVTGVYDPSDPSAVYTPFGPFKFDNTAPEFQVDNMVISGNLKNRTISFEMPSDNNGSGLQTMSLYYIPKNSENGEGVLLKNFTRDNFSGEPLKLEYTVSHKAVGACVDENGNEILDRQDVEFYWIISDKLGNTNEEPIRFKLTFDTNDYLSSEIKESGPKNFTDNAAYKIFEYTTEKIDEFTFIYNYRLNKDKQYSIKDGNKVSYGFRFLVDHTLFGATDNGNYSANVYYKGEKITEYFVDDKHIPGSYVIWFYGETRGGRYDIQLVRTEGGSVRTSHTYSVYFTDGHEDATEVKGMVESGTLLKNTVYQLSSQYPHFYYKDINGTIQKEYYNGVKQPASFSSYSKAKEYVYYNELADIYLIQLTGTTANALNSGTAGYLIAKGETVIPQAGQYWIRYKSSAWTPTSGDNAWVYYYYGMSDELNDGAFSEELQTALNEVSKRITDYGGYVVLTDTSLFLGNAMGDNMLDSYGMPYLLDGQIHAKDELSNQTKCGNKWSLQVYFAADKNIYTSKVHVGIEGTEEYKEYPIIGNFKIPNGSKFQYMTYEEYGSSATWKPLIIGEGESFIDVIKGSGIYYIREMSAEGVSIYAIYIDKAAPEVSFTMKDENGATVEIPVDGVEITDIRTNNLIIGGILPSEYDRLAYVAIYKVSNLSLVGVYTAEELDLAPISLEDGNYYIVVSDRSGNHYTVTAKVSSSNLECVIKEYPDKFIKLTCNRRDDQISRYEVYLNGELVTSTYAAEQTFEKAGLYTIYVQDIYGNEFSQEIIFKRNYPTVNWKYLGSDGKFHAYDSESVSTDGFVMTWLSDNNYKISTSVKTRFSFSGNYGYEFIGGKPEYNESVSAETVVTIAEGQSFTLKVYYKNHADCYVIYTGVVDVTPPSISVSAEMNELSNGEQNLFDQWIASGKVGEDIALNELYYTLVQKRQRTVVNGGDVSSDIIRINVSDANDLSKVDVYLDDALIKSQDVNSGFSQIIVSRWGRYKIVAKDALGNVSEFNFVNGKPEGVNYYVDGVKKEIELHSYLNFENVDGKHVYTKVDYGNNLFKLDLANDGNVFVSVGVSGGETAIYGFKVSGGCVYPLTYRVVVDADGDKEVNLVAGNAIVDVSSPDFRLDKEYLLNVNGVHAIYATVDANNAVSIKVYAPEDTSKILSVSARVELLGKDAVFVSSEISKKKSEIVFEDANGKDITSQLSNDIRVNNGFIINNEFFNSERVSSIQLYYSKLNDLDVNSLLGKNDIYADGKLYTDDGFYILIVKNLYGNESVYRIGISTSFGITSSVTFADGQKIHYSKDYVGKLYSNKEIAIDLFDESVKYSVTSNGNAYTGYQKKTENGIVYLVFSEEGIYEIRLTDSYGNVLVKQLEINKSTYTVDDKLLTGYNEKALKRNEGYTNQKLSVDKTVFDGSGIYYLAVKYGDTLNVLVDAFSETSVNADYEKFANAIGSNGDGVYTVICRNRYGAVVTKDIHYRSTPTLKLERTTRSQTEAEIYDLNYAVSLGFWSNNTLIFSTEANNYQFTVNGNVTECPRTLAFDNAGDFGSSEYDITYIDEYGFEYNFKAYLIRKNVTVDLSADVQGIEIDGILNTRNDISITFGENTYATYTINNGESFNYRSGDVLKKDGTYRFTVIDYAGNVSTMIVRKDTMVDFMFVESNTSNVIQSGAVVNSSKVALDILNKDSAYIERVLKDGVVQIDFVGTKFSEDGKWEVILSDKLGNKAYFCFYIITRMQNGFSYTTPYEYHVAEMWFDSGDGVRVSYMNFVNHTDYNSSFNFIENGKYTVVMASAVTGKTSSFEFTVNTLAPEVSLVGCNPGETTIKDVSIAGCKVGDTIKIYQATDTGEKLVQKVEVTSTSTKMPIINEGGTYRVVVESEAGVATELTFVRKHVMNTAGSIFIMIMIAIAVVGLFAGLIYRNKSKTDN